eukprot:Phypoly_transcript_11392.p2 GENE.Phypoly_transcript_11392~~Phypoly_transcript_11392.p2  ORF type:complete len:114 (+),score=19.83 Phypoly_transcript_11392:195-536(+)
MHSFFRMGNTSNSVTQKRIEERKWVQKQIKKEKEILKSAEEKTKQFLMEGKRDKAREAWVERVCSKISQLTEDVDRLSYLIETDPDESQYTGYSFLPFFTIHSLFYSVFIFIL